MPVMIRAKKYYRIKEASEFIGIGRSTFLRWVREDKIKGASHKDVRAEGYSPRLI